MFIFENSSTARYRSVCLRSLCIGTLAPHTISLHSKIYYVMDQSILIMLHLLVVNGAVTSSV